MKKTEIIARRILGWKLNNWDKWYDFEKGVFIPVADFQPENNLEHAIIVADRLKTLGFTYKTDGVSKASFDDYRGTGETLAQAITNAAFSIADNSWPEEEWL